jgi:cystinosin
MAEWVVVLIIISIELSGVKLGFSYNTVRFCGYAKAVISFVKYCPQVYLNWKRKSTVGWSLENVILDLTGGSFSMLQTMVDAFGRGKSPFEGDGFNIVKFMLSCLSIFFDIIFLI